MSDTPITNEDKAVKRVNDGGHTKDLERAIIKLAYICDHTPINPDLRATATMYMNALHEAYKTNYVRWLEEECEYLRKLLNATRSTTNESKPKDVIGDPSPSPSKGIE